MGWSDDSTITPDADPPTPLSAMASYTHGEEAFVHALNGAKKSTSRQTPPYHRAPSLPCNCSTPGYDPNTPITTMATVNTVKAARRKHLPDHPERQ